MSAETDITEVYIQAKSWIDTLTKGIVQIQKEVKELDRILYQIQKEVQELNERVGKLENGELKSVLISSKKS